jgi:hypothetical protein
LIAFLEKAVLDCHIPKVVYVRGVLIEVIGTVGPYAGRQSPENAIPYRDVREDNSLVSLVGKEANA